MKRRQLFIGLGLLVLSLAIITGCSSSSGTLAELLLPEVTKSITAAAGGTIETSSGSTKLTLDIPAGALAADTNITLTPLAKADVFGDLANSDKVLSAVTFEPAGTMFTTPVTATFPLTVAKPAGTVLPLMLWNAGTSSWDLAGQAVVQAGGLTATAALDHFSTYTLVDYRNLRDADVSQFLFGPSLAYQQDLAVPADMSIDIVQLVGPVLHFNCYIAETALDYDTMTQAPAVVYAPNQQFPLAKNKVYVGYALDYNLDELDAPVINTFFFKMRTLGVLVPNGVFNQDTAVTFEFERISAPPLNIAGQWKMNQVWNMTITPGAGNTYTAEIVDWGPPMQGLTGTLNGHVYSGTYAYLGDYADGNSPGTFTITFSQSGLTYTAVFTPNVGVPVTYTGSR